MRQNGCLYLANWLRLLRSTKIAHYDEMISEKEETKLTCVITHRYNDIQRIDQQQYRVEPYWRSCSGIYCAVFTKSSQRHTLILISFELLDSAVFATATIHSILLFVDSCCCLVFFFLFLFIFGKRWCSWTVACKTVTVRDTKTTRKSGRRRWRRRQMLTSYTI